eukprot:TRINITY_DN7294_c0_g3_i1.p1 TRINITY_DN7294_c0_g3~~TRINITY_DN7294_c0_g3_i1.p1  ORF type:complete len:512 (+),score=61.00 TRINITY_DN7294_c0_g3_i1:42-1577(+)
MEKVSFQFFFRVWMARCVFLRLVAALESSTSGQGSELHAEARLFSISRAFNHTEVWASLSSQIGVRFSLAPPPSLLKCLGATLAGSFVALLGMFAEGLRERKRARLASGSRSNGIGSCVRGSFFAKGDIAVVEAGSVGEAHGQSAQCVAKAMIGGGRGDSCTAPLLRADSLNVGTTAPANLCREGDRLGFGSSAGSSIRPRRFKNSGHRPTETSLNAVHGCTMSESERVERQVKSILNKMTRASFGKLYFQLLDCLSKTETREGIIGVVAREVFAKATLQHSFVEMYADVCAKLNDDLQKMNMHVNFRRALLDQCQRSFNLHLDPPRIDGAKDQECQYEQLVKYKTIMLGNVRLIGHLLNRGMLSAKIIFHCADELLSIGSPEALETLCVLLGTIGATFDTPRWQGHARLEAVFMRTELFAGDLRQCSRTRCLLKDLFDRRRNRWRDRRQKASAVVPSAVGAIGVGGATRAGASANDHCVCARLHWSQDQRAERDLVDGNGSGKVGIGIVT